MCFLQSLLWHEIPLLCQWFIKWPSVQSSNNNPSIVINLQTVNWPWCQPFKNMQGTSCNLIFVRFTHFGLRITVQQAQTTKHDRWTLPGSADFLYSLINIISKLFACCKHPIMNWTNGCGVFPLGHWCKGHHWIDEVFDLNLHVLWDPRGRQERVIAKLKSNKVVHL